MIASIVVAVELADGSESGDRLDEVGAMDR
jgi:hypothetical protein